MAAFEGWFAPVPRGESMSARSALVVMSDLRPAVATTLILQEMGLTVDVGVEASFALRWLRRARYDVVVAGGPGVGDLAFAAQLRDAAPSARIVLLAEPHTAVEAGRLGVEVLTPPLDVNVLVECFRPHDGLDSVGLDTV